MNIHPSIYHQPVNSSADAYAYLENLLVFVNNTTDYYFTYNITVTPEHNVQLEINTNDPHIGGFISFTKSNYLNPPENLSYSPAGYHNTFSSKSLKDALNKHIKNFYTPLVNLNKHIKNFYTPLVKRN